MNTKSSLTGSQDIAPVEAKCLVCSQTATFVLHRDSRSIWSCTKTDCLEKNENMLLSLCFLDSHTF